MFIARSPPNPDGAVRRSGTQVYRYRPGSFRSSERHHLLCLVINISLLRSEDLRLELGFVQLAIFVIVCLITRLESDLVAA